MLLPYRYPDFTENQKVIDLPFGNSLSPIRDVNTDWDKLNVFDGVNDCIKGASPITTTFAMEYGFTPAKNGADYGATELRLWGSDDTRGSSYEIRPYLATTYNATFMSSGGFVVNLDQDDFIKDEYAKWLITLDQVGSDATISVYKDDILKFTKTGTTTLDHSNNEFYAMMWNNSYVLGHMPYMKLWNDAEQQNLVLDWNIKSYAQFGPEGVEDLSGMGNHGTSYGKCTFERSTSATVLDRDGRYVEVLAEYPRIEDAKHATNLASRSNNLNDAVWTTAQSTIGARTKIENIYLDEVVEDSTADSTHYISQSGLAREAGLTYMESVYVKRGDGERNIAISLESAIYGVELGIVVDLSNGEILSVIGPPLDYGVILCGNDIYRIYVSGECTTSGTTPTPIYIINNTDYSYDGDGTSSVYSGRYQVERVLT